MVATNTKEDAPDVTENPTELVSGKKGAVSAEFQDWVDSYPALYFLRVPKDAWTNMTRAERNLVIAHNRAVEPGIEKSVAHAARTDTFVVFGEDIWKSLPHRIRQLVHSHHATLIAALCARVVPVMLPEDCWRVITVEQKRAIVGHNRELAALGTFLPVLAQ